MSLGRKTHEGDTPLSRLAAGRGRHPAFLTSEEHQAGERLRADYTRAHIMAATIQRWDLQPRAAGNATGAGDLSDSALDARRRVEKALLAIGPELNGVVIDICCYLKGLEMVERERQWPARSAKMMLKAGLGILVRHHGLTSGIGGATHIRRWGTPDSRPAINAES